MSFTEEDFIRWITAPAEGSSRHPEAQLSALRVGPGDDGAMLADGTLVCVDTVVEGVHFAPGSAPADVARKALGSCLSDICAMGGVAETVLVAAQLPGGTDGRALAAGLREWAQRFAVQMAGGDTVAAGSGVLALSVTATGHLPPGTSPWLRSGAQLGDLLVVSGPLGGAQHGRHLAVVPRSDLVSELRGSGLPVHAAMDLSDGLAVDLPRLLAASGVGAAIDGAAVPIHADVAEQSDRLHGALTDGEDFELLLAIDGSCAAPRGTTIIGAITGSGLSLRDAHGEARPWPTQGFSHAF